MIRRLGVGALMAIAVILLTGCWNRRELNELSIAFAMGLDRGEDNQYTVSFQLVNPSQVASKNSGGPSAAPVSTFSEKGISVFEAVRKLNTKVNRKIYLSHLRVVVFGEELARKGIADALDFMSRDHEMRTNFYIIVAKDAKAEDVLKILTPREKVPANHLFSSLAMSDKFWAATGKITLDELIDDLVNEGKSPVLTGLMIHGPVERGSTFDNMQTSALPTVMQYDGMAAFKTDRLIGWLGEDESKGYHYVQGKVKSTVVVNECRSGRLEVELLQTHTRVKGLIKNGEPVVNIGIHAVGNVGDVNCEMDMADPSSVKEIERMTSKQIREVVDGAVRMVQTRYKTDIFGFGEAIRRSSPKMWKKWKRNWDEKFEDMTVNTHVNVDIRRIGTINQPIKSRVRK